MNRIKNKRSIRNILLLILIAGMVFLLASVVPLSANTTTEDKRVKVSVPGTGSQLCSERFGVAQSQLVLDGAQPGNTDVDKEFQEIRAAGIKMVRCQFAWSDIQKTRNSWDWTGVDKVIRAADPNDPANPNNYDVKVLGILNFTPSWAFPDGKNSSYPPANPQDWKDYVSALITRINTLDGSSHKGTAFAWEVWNEEDGGNVFEDQVTDKDTRGADYVNKLLKPTWDVVKQVDPTAKVVMGGLAETRRTKDMGTGWESESLENKILIPCLKAGAYKYMDAIAYHPKPLLYVPANTSFEARESYCRVLIRTIRDLMNSYSTAYKPEIWITETGFFWAWPNEENQANSTLRTLINYADVYDKYSNNPDSNNTDYMADKVFYFNLRDELPDIYEGLIGVDYVERQAYRYFSTFESVFGPTVPFVPSFIASSCDGMYDGSLDEDGRQLKVLEEHYFKKADGDLAIAFWKSNDVNSTLTFTIRDAGYANLVQVNLDNRTHTFIPFTRDASGYMTASNISIGRIPVVIQAQKLRVSAITPTSGNQGSVVNITNLAGTGFKPGATVRLEMGSTTIPATNVNVVSGTQITCQFNLASTTPVGSYNVVVKNADAPTEVRLSGGFTVSSVSPPCGAGAGGAALMLGMALGLLTFGGSLRMIKRRKGRGTKVT